MAEDQTMVEKPEVQIAGVDGNVFSVLGAAAKALRKQGQGDKVSEMQQRVFQAHSYHEALAIMLDYVEFV